jgi:hypothetical protein
MVQAALAHCSNLADRFELAHDYERRSVAATPVLSYILHRKKAARPRKSCLLIGPEVITTSGIVIHNVVAALKRL